MSVQSVANTNCVSVQSVANTNCVSVQSVANTNCVTWTQCKSDIIQNVHASLKLDSEELPGHYVCITDALMLVLIRLYTYAIKIVIIRLLYVKLILKPCTIIYMYYSY